MLSNNIIKADRNLMESREVIGFVGGGGSSSSCGIASSTAPPAASAGGTRTNLLHFNTTSTSTSTSSSAAHTLFFGSSPEEEGMLNGRGPAFTLVQREELERQTMIFKYMMASVPVPPHLLLPLTKNQRNCVSSSSSSGGGATDSEPWRCRRTDGKKWRCSRDVAPHQKYCERHSHKNRPRSRKPVESSSSSVNTTRLQQISNSRNNNNSSSVTAVTSAVTCHQDSSHHHYLALNTTQRDFSHASAPPSPRCLEWFTRGEVIAVPNSDQDWHHQHTKDLYHLKHHSHVPPLSPYPEQAQPETLNDQCSLLLGLPSSLEGASNTDDHDKAGPCSSLSLAVFSDHVAQDRAGKLIYNDDDGSSGKSGGELKPHWMSSGGPLAEALCLGSTALGKSGPTDG